MTTLNKPCNHPGCLNHVTHPCEGCGRIQGRYIVQLKSMLTVGTKDYMRLDLNFEGHGLTEIQIKIPRGASLNVIANRFQLITDLVKEEISRQKLLGG